MSSRERVIVELLVRLPELVDPMQSRSGLGDGVALPLMPGTWTASVREVERLLRVMREDRSSPLLVDGAGVRIVVDGQPVSVRRLWWHVRGFYVDVDRSPVVPQRVRVPRSKRRQLVRLATDATGRALPQRRERRDPAARRSIAELGVAWMAAHWSLKHEPFLPVEVVGEVDRGRVAA